MHRTDWGSNHSPHGPLSGTFNFAVITQLTTNVSYSTRVTTGTLRRRRRRRGATRHSGATTRTLIQIVTVVTVGSTKVSRERVTVRLWDRIRVSLQIFKTSTICFTSFGRGEVTSASVLHCRSELLVLTHVRASFETTLNLIPSLGR